MTAKRLHSTVRVAGARRAVDFSLDGANLSGTVDGKPASAEVALGGEGEVVLRIGGKRVTAIVSRRGAVTWVSIGGATYEVERVEAAAAEAVVGAEPFATSPMAGLLAKVHVAAGASVARGGALFSVEAMKMEYVVAADRDVKVIEVRRKAGDRVTLGEVIVAFEQYGVR